MRLAPIDERYSITESGKVWDKRWHRFKKQTARKETGHVGTDLYGRFVYIKNLVAERWLRKPKQGESLRHIDGDRANNHYSNLEWCGTEKQRTIAASPDETRKQMTLRIAKEYMQD